MLPLPVPDHRDGVGAPAYRRAGQGEAETGAADHGDLVGAVKNGVRQAGNGDSFTDRDSEVACEAVPPNMVMPEVSDTPVMALRLVAVVAALHA